MLTPIYLPPALGAGVLGIRVPGAHDDGGVGDEGGPLRRRHHLQAHPAVDVLIWGTHSCQHYSVFLVKAIAFS